MSIVVEVFPHPYLTEDECKRLGLGFRLLYDHHKEANCKLIERAENSQFWRPVEDLEKGDLPQTLFHRRINEHEFHPELNAAKGNDSLEFGPANTIAQSHLKVLGRAAESRSVSFVIANRWSETEIKELLRRFLPPRLIRDLTMNGTSWNM